MLIKVCGITDLKQLLQLDGLEVDFAGLNFYKDSPRFIGNKINPKELQTADLDIKLTGVFVNEGYDEIMNKVNEYNLSVVQLHGDESPELCRKISEETEVIKAFRISPDNEDTIEKLLIPYDDACDYYLFDNGALKESLGGTGQSFDWEILKRISIEKPFFLSGGIGPDDIEKLTAFRHPDFYAIDINSKFEKNPGVKDMGLLLGFVRAVRAIRN